MIFQRPMGPAHVHDHRLGRALDALWGAGLDRIYGAVISQAIQRSALALARLHPDPTSLKRYGAYERAAEEAGPLVTFGYRRDHRPDLKPLRFGLTVTAEGGPVWGHVADGHQSDSTEQRCQITQRRQHLPDLGASLLVAASTFLAGETMALAAAHRFRLVTLVPQTVSPRPLVVEAPELRELPLLGEQPGRRHGALDQ